MEERKYIIKTKGLTKRFKKSVVVDHVDLLVPEQCVYGFLGPNGAGKTTTIRMLLSLIQASEGEIEIFGKTFTSSRKFILSQIGSLVESPSLYGELSGEDNLKVYTKLLKSNPEKIQEVLETVRLTDAAKKKVKKYSLGMKQRLGIALALVNSPKLLILDEPTNGLDPAGIREVRDLIKNLPHEHKITVFVSSHLLSEVELMVDYVGILNKGKIKFQGSMHELQQQKVSKLTIATNNNQHAAVFLESKHIPVVEDNGAIVSTVTDSQKAGDINHLLVTAGFQVTNLHVCTQPLEDLFMKLTNE
ncbi:MAG: ABC transporter ATP-binding protein [Candidatus Dojkabacteria bacterium]